MPAKRVEGCCVRVMGVMDSRGKFTAGFSESAAKVPGLSVAVRASDGSFDTTGYVPPGPSPGTNEWVIL